MAGETQVAPIIFAGGEDTSASALGGAMPTVVNALPDAAGVVRRRPGISTWDPFPTAAISSSAVIGMAPFGSNLVYVTADRKLHAVNVQSGVTELSDDTRATQLDGSARPSIVSGRNMLVVAGGGAIQKWTGTGLSSRLQNNGAGGDPPEATFLCAVAQRLVAQCANKSGQIWWTGPLEDYENWDMATGGASYIQAAAKPDPLVAMLDNTNEVFTFGTETTQVFAPSALAVDSNDLNNLLDFAPSRTMNLGTVSPFSVVAVDDMFGLIDRHRRVVLTDGRSYSDVSKPVVQALRNMASITDAWAFRMRFGRFDCLVWMFPSNGYGLIYDTAGSKWCEWRAWDRGPVDVSITSAYNWAEQNVFLVGLSNGQIAKLDDSAWTDLTAPVKVEVVSGFTTHGTQAQKCCNTLMLYFRRTWAELPAPTNGLTASGHVRVSFRDDEGSWELVEDVELSSTREPCLQIRSLGVYRSRQWKVEYTGSDEIQLVSAQEEYEVLGA